MKTMVVEILKKLEEYKTILTLLNTLDSATKLSDTNPIEYIILKSNLTIKVKNYLIILTKDLEATDSNKSKIESITYSLELFCKQGAIKKLSEKDKDGLVLHTLKTHKLDISLDDLKAAYQAFKKGELNINPTQTPIVVNEPAKIKIMFADFLSLWYGKDKLKELRRGKKLQLGGKKTPIYITLDGIQGYVSFALNDPKLNAPITDKAVLGFLRQTNSYSLGQKGITPSITAASGSLEMIDLGVCKIMGKIDLGKVSASEGELSKLYTDGKVAFNWISSTFQVSSTTKFNTFFEGTPILNNEVV